MRHVLLVLSVIAVAACAGRAAAPAASPVAIGVEESRGWAREAVARRVASHEGSLRRCGGPNGGKLNVRITSEDGHLRVHIEPGASLEPAARECVLEALSRIDGEDTGADAALPPRSGFTSLVSLAW